MKKALIILAVVAAIAVGWFFINNTSDDDSLEFEGTEQQDFPVRTDESTSTADLTTYTSEFNNLSFEHPETWAVAEGADNEAASQLYTVESPLDANEFYFCLDITRVAAGSDADFTVEDAEVLSVDHLDSGPHSVIYSVEGVNGQLWGVADDEVEVGANTFTSETTNAAGDRLQVLGRFNCRDTERPDLSLEEIQAARWFEEAKAIINSLQF